MEVGLFRDNILIETIKIDGDMGWKYTWKDLDTTDKYGQPYDYRVDELSEIEGYQSSVDGNVITNTFIEEPPVETPKELPKTGSINLKYISGMSIALGIYLLRKRKEN